MNHSREWQRWIKTKIEEDAKKQTPVGRLLADLERKKPVKAAKEVRESGLPAADIVADFLEGGAPQG